MTEPVTPPPVFDPLNPPPRKPATPEDDPNLSIKSMIASRKAKPTEEDKKIEEGADETTKAEDKVKTAKVNVALSDALGFRKTKPKEEKKEDEPPAADDKKEEVKAEEEKKTIVSKKKSAPIIDTAKIATEAAVAATREALKIREPAEKKEEKSVPDLVNEDDIRTYEVAKFMADTNPKYKNADRLVVEHAKKAQSYADRWEAEHPGKVFDPDDDAHDEFYASLEKPWSDGEFRRAEIALEVKRAKDEWNKDLEATKEKEKPAAAAASLKPIVEKATLHSAILMAKNVGDDVLDAIKKDGLEKFSEDSPIVSAELVKSMNSIAPMIETIIQLDDPDGRVSYDPKNQAHREWAEFLLGKEESYRGEVDASGKIFASRSEWASMSSMKRQRHWYLTTEKLLEDLVSDTSELTKQAIESETNKQKKLAERMGYVLKQDGGGSSKKPDATKTPSVKAEEKTTTASEKPVSPTASSGAKIDESSNGKKTGYGGLLEATGNILFQR